MKEEKKERISLSPVLSDDDDEEEEEEKKKKKEEKDEEETASDLTMLRRGKGKKTVRCRRARQGKEAERRAKRIKKQNNNAKKKGNEGEGIKLASSHGPLPINFSERQSARNGRIFLTVLFGTRESGDELITPNAAG